MAIRRHADGVDRLDDGGVDELALAARCGESQLSTVSPEFSWRTANSEDYSRFI